jgi:hypothetical protein
MPSAPGISVQLPRAPEGVGWTGSGAELEEAARAERVPPPVLGPRGQVHAPAPDEIGRQRPAPDAVAQVDEGRPTVRDHDGVVVAAEAGLYAGGDLQAEHAPEVHVAAPGEQRRVAVVGEGEDGVVFEEPVHAAGGGEDPADVPVRRPEPLSLGLEAVVVGYGVPLEEVHEVEGADLSLTSIAPMREAYSSFMPAERRRPPLALRPLSPVSRL